MADHGDERAAQDRPAGATRSLWADFVLGAARDGEPEGEEPQPGPAGVEEPEGAGVPFPRGAGADSGDPGAVWPEPGPVAESRWPVGGLPPQFGRADAPLEAATPFPADDAAVLGDEVSAPAAGELAWQAAPDSAVTAPESTSWSPADAMVWPAEESPAAPEPESAVWPVPEAPEPVEWSAPEPPGRSTPDTDAVPLAQVPVDHVPEGPPVLGELRPAQPPSGRENAESSDSLTADALLPGRRSVPSAGWRKVAYRASGGRMRTPQTAAERRRRDLLLRACTPVTGGHRRVAVLSLKGGVGKTTTTVGLGATLASARGDRVIAVDANPDRGTLCDKLRLETSATIRDLLNERDRVQRYADVRAYTTQAPSRLEVLASDRDPTVSVAFSAEDYREVAEVLEHFYSICVTDCGTGLLHSAMGGVLGLADQIVLVSSPSVDGARSASATLDWLAAHNCGDLVREAVVVLCAVLPRRRSSVDLGRLEQHFLTRCRAVVRIPYDPHLAEGAEVDLARLNRATADAYLALAAAVGEAFAQPRATMS